MQPYLYAVYDTNICIFFRLHLSQLWIAFGSVFCSVLIIIHNESAFLEENSLKRLIADS